MGFTVVDFFLLLLSSYFANKLNVNKETESLGASSSVMSVYKRERKKTDMTTFSIRKSCADRRKKERNF